MTPNSLLTVNTETHFLELFLTAPISDCWPLPQAWVAGQEFEGIREESKTGRLPGRCPFLQGCESSRDGQEARHAAGEYRQPGPFEIHAQQRCHRGILGCQWGLGRLARWEGLLLNPAPGRTKPVSLWLIFGCR